MEQMMPYSSYYNQLPYYYNSTNQISSPIKNIPIHQSAQNSFIYPKYYPYDYEYSIQCQQSNQAQLIIIQPQIGGSIISNEYPLSSTSLYQYGPYMPKCYQQVLNFAKRNAGHNFREQSFENNRNRSLSNIETNSPSSSSSV
jgi:hypothetical protein